MPIDIEMLPIFEDTCYEWLRRLNEDRSFRASFLRCEARVLQDLLRSWRFIPPANDAERVKAIDAVMSLHRRCLEYITKSRGLEVGSREEQE